MMMEKNSGLEDVFWRFLQCEDFQDHRNLKSSVHIERNSEEKPLINGGCFLIYHILDWFLFLLCTHPMHFPCSCTYQPFSLSIWHHCWKLSRHIYCYLFKKCLTEVTFNWEDFRNPFICSIRWYRTYKDHDLLNGAFVFRRPQWNNNRVNPNALHKVSPFIIITNYHLVKYETNKTRIFWHFEIFFLLGTVARGSRFTNV